MIKQEYDITIIDKIKRLFKKPKQVNVDDLGIFHEVISFGTRTDMSHDLIYDVFAKIKVVAVYDNLVEVQVINLKVSDSVSQDITNLITNNFPKYVNPKNVSWEVKKDNKIR